MKTNCGCRIDFYHPTPCHPTLVARGDWNPAWQAGPGTQPGRALVDQYNDRSPPGYEVVLARWADSGNASIQYLTQLRYGDLFPCLRPK